MIVFTENLIPEEIREPFNDFLDYQIKVAVEAEREAIALQADQYAKRERERAARPIARNYDVTYEHMHTSIAKEYEDFAAAIRERSTP